MRPFNAIKGLISREDSLRAEIARLTAKLEKGTTPKIARRILRDFKALRAELAEIVAAKLHVEAAPIRAVEKAEGGRVGKAQTRVKSDKQSNRGFARGLNSGAPAKPSRRPKAEHRTPSPKPTLIPISAFLRDCD